MKKLILLLISVVSVASAEEPISFINIFSGSYELPKYCKNYPRENDSNYNIQCEEPSFKYFVTIYSEDKPCPLGSEMKSNERVVYNIQKEFISHDLIFSQVSLNLKSNGVSHIFRIISSEKECLTISASKVEELDLVKIGSW